MVFLKNRKASQALVGVNWEWYISYLFSILIGDWCPKFSCKRELMKETIHVLGRLIQSKNNFSQSVQGIGDLLIIPFCFVTFLKHGLSVSGRSHLAGSWPKDLYFQRLHVTEPTNQACHFWNENAWRWRPNPVGYLVTRFFVPSTPQKVTSGIAFFSWLNFSVTLYLLINFKSPLAWVGIDNWPSFSWLVQVLFSHWHFTQYSKFSLRRQLTLSPLQIINFKIKLIIF